MLDKELREKGPPDTFDNTLITSYLSCPRAEYWFLRRLGRKKTPSYFVWGRAFGAAISVYSSLEGKPLEERKLKAMLAARKIWDNEDLEIFDNRPNDTWENLEATFDLYVDAYGEKEPWHSIQHEVGFKFPIPHTSLFYGGSLDDYIEWPPYGTLLREDKSTGAYITPTYLASWKHSSQVTGYIWAVRQMVENVFGALMNITSKRPRKDPLLRFHRQLETRSDWRITEFIQQTVGIADTIRGEWDKWEWPKWGERNPYQCAGGPGISPCIYRNLCLQEMEPWELEDKYNFSEEFTWREEWTPWKRQGEGEGEKDG